jgi:hypothetical protein
MIVGDEEARPTVGVIGPTGWGADGSDHDGGCDDGGGEDGGGGVVCVMAPPLSPVGGLVWRLAQVEHWNGGAAEVSAAWAVSVAPPIVRAVKAIGIANVRGILAIVLLLSSGVGSCPSRHYC